MFSNDRLVVGGPIFEEIVHDRFLTESCPNPFCMPNYPELTIPEENRLCD